MGFWETFTSPQSFHDRQVPSAIPSATFSPSSMVLTLQIGNIFLLLAAMAIICVFTPHPEIAKWYLIAVALGDLGHIWSCYVGMGSSFWDVGSWNGVVWGNIGASAFLHVNRLATVFGLFGRIKKRIRGNAKRA